MKPLPLATALLTSAALPLASCGLRDANHRHVLGGSTALSGVSPVPATNAERHDPRSIAAPDRASWQPTVFTVPVDGTVHGPVRTRRVAMAHATARQKGLEPTIHTALDLNAAQDRQVAEGLIAPFAAGLDAALLPASLVARPPGSATTSPRTLYKRHADGAWLHGPAATPAPGSVPTATTPAPTSAQPPFEAPAAAPAAAPAGILIEPL